jgi:hypothetical protein
MQIPIWSGNGTPGALVVNPDGQLDLYGVDAPGFSDLAGVSYPAKGLVVKTITLRKGWTTSPVRKSVASYAVTGGVVHLSGWVHRASGTGNLFATLPKAARPAHVLYITIETYSDISGVLNIAPNGNAEAYNGQASSLTWLGGISYPAAKTGMRKLTLLNGWHSEQASFQSGNPSYRVSGGVVYLSGSMATSGTNKKFALLPPGARPANYLYINTYTVAGSVGTIRVTPGGVMQVYAVPFSNASAFTSLAGISFALGS